MSATVQHQPIIIRSYGTMRQRGSTHDGSPVDASTVTVLRPSRTMTTIRRKAPPKLTADLFESPAALVQGAPASAAHPSISSSPPSAIPTLRRSISLKALRTRPDLLSGQDAPPIPTVPPPLQKQFVLEIDELKPDTKATEDPNAILRLLGADALARGGERSGRRGHFHWLYARDRDDNDSSGSSHSRNRAGTVGSSVKTFRGLLFFKSTSPSSSAPQDVGGGDASRSSGRPARQPTKCLEISVPTGLVHVSSGAATSSARGRDSSGSSIDASAAVEMSSFSSSSSTACPSFSASDRTASSPVLFTAALPACSGHEVGASARAGACEGRSAGKLGVGRGLASPFVQIPLRSSSYGSKTSPTTQTSLKSASLNAARHNKGPDSSQASSTSLGSFCIPPSSAVGPSTTSPLRPARSIRRPSPANMQRRLNIADDSLGRHSPSAAFSRREVTTVGVEVTDTVTALVSLSDPDADTTSHPQAEASRMSELIADRPVRLLVDKPSWSDGSSTLLPSVREFEKQLQRTLTASRHHPILSKRSLNLGSTAAGAKDVAQFGGWSDDEESSDESHSLSDVEGWEYVQSPNVTTSASAKRHARIVV